jgi:selenocysteine lyase/cysteine desulfurase
MPRSCRTPCTIATCTPSLCHLATNVPTHNPLIDASRIEVPVKCVQGRLYVRLSAHLYNQLSDYERLADAMHRIALHGFPSWE